MTKRSTNFGGPKRWRRGLEMRSIIETMRVLGMSDQEIKETVLRMAREQKKEEKPK